MPNGNGQDSGLATTEVFCHEFFFVISEMIRIDSKGVSLLFSGT